MSGKSFYSLPIKLWRRTFTLQNNLPPDYSTSQSQPSFIQMLLKTSTFQITHILHNIMHMLLNLNILLYTRIIPLCKLLNTKHLCTKFFGIMHLSCHFQTPHIKCLCTKGLLCHTFWNYIRPDSRLGGNT